MQFLDGSVSVSSDSVEVPLSSDSDIDDEPPQADLDPHSFGGIAQRAMSKGKNSSVLTEKSWHKLKKKF